MLIWTHINTVFFPFEDCSGSRGRIVGDQSYRLREMLERVRVTTSDTSLDGDNGITESEKEEQIMKTLFHSKLDDTIGSSTKAKVALQRMMRLELDDSTANEPRESRLQRYKALLQSLTDENHVLKKQLAQLRDRDQSTSFSSSSEK